MSNEIGLLAKVLQTNEEELKTKLADENGVKEIETRIGNLKVFKSNEEFTSMMNNYKTSLKDTLYAEQKGSIHESLENSLINKFGLSEVKRGEHFKTTDELINKIIEEKTKVSKASADGNDKELEKAQAKILELNNALIERETNLKKEYGSKLKGMQINATLSGIKSMIDEPDDIIDGKLDFIKYQFEKEFSLVEKDGKFIVYKGEEVFRDENFKEKPLESVLMEIASKISKVKSSPASGRGANSKTTSRESGTLDFSSFKTWDDFLNANSELRNLRIGDPKLNKYYEQFRKSKGE